MVRTGLFALTLFLASGLSFTAQPMVGKMLLPLLGGTPAVWAACLVFFQAALLAGYLYAHRTAGAPPRRQARRHALVLLLPLAAFAAAVGCAGQPVPVAAGLLPAGADYPILPLLAALTLAIGVPFTTLAATAPLLMRWYGGGQRAHALYAASNAGSLLGLLGYPLLIEPWLPVAAQQWGWAGGVAACLGLIAACGGLASDDAPPPRPATAPPAEWLTWFALAALPSALLTSVSTVLTAEVAPVPLLWVVPLGLYLISFIVVFAWWAEPVHRAVWRFSVPLVLFVALILVTRSADPIALACTLHLAAFLGVCFVCHGELVLRRPPAERLTAFYLALAAGGVTGGLAAGLLAPLVFCRVGFAEYPLALALACLVRPRGVGPDDRLRATDLAWAVAVGLLTLGLIAAASRLLGPPEGSDPLVRLGRYGLKYGPPLALTFALVWRRWRFALSLAAVFLAGAADDGPIGVPLYTERNFFGTLQVVRSRDGRFVRLVHGATQHGQQRLDEPGRPTPLLYYHPTGPAGRLFRALPAERGRRVGVVGMGCGALAAYGRAGQRWTFFEIDPAVIRIARDPRFFTFLQACEAEVEVDAGDGRQRLAARDDVYDVLVLDAFNSDAIPTHLLTREALGLYLDHLAPAGVIAFHVSNRYLDLPPLLGRLAAERGLAVRVDNDQPTDREVAEGKSPSSWVVMARDEGALAVIARDLRWERPALKPGPVWTDQYSSILGVWRVEE